MPEFPDILLYLHALRPRIVGRRLIGVRLASPFLLRSIDPPLTAVHGRRVVDLHRIGKRIAIELEGELFLVFHLMIAGRFRWTDVGSAFPALSEVEGRRTAPAPRRIASQRTAAPPDDRRPAIPGKVGLLALDFENGTLVMTEAGTQKRASLYVVPGRSSLEAHNPGGIEIFETDWAGFDCVLRHENHTLKRSLTDPHLFSGIGNAYSDEILHAARLSPFKQTRALSDEESRRLFDATRLVLSQWTARLRDDTGERFPEKVTAFREGMAVHGRYGKPCPECGSPVQRVVYASNEANYCATCQTGGRLLADRSLSRLLREDWPRTLEELEVRRKTGRVPRLPSVAQRAKDGSGPGGETPVGRVPRSGPARRRR